LEYDYYKLLGLKTGSDFREVRKAFLQAARRYHPDYNPNDTAAEQMMKVLNQGYELLSNPGKKEVYDALLYAHYRKRETPKTQVSERESREERRQRAREILREREAEFVADYKRKFRSLRLQLFLLPLLVLGAPVYACLNWFADEASYDHLLTFLSLACFLASVLRMAALLWRYLNVQHILKNQKFHDAWIYGVVLAIIGLTPWLVYEGAQWRYRYHLEQFAATTSLQLESYQNGLLRYSFTVGNRRIEKLKNGFFWNASGPIDINSVFKVRYSTRDPRIAEIILASPQP
jgi:hypothetical protein